MEPKRPSVREKPIFWGDPKIPQKVTGNECLDNMGQQCLYWSSLQVSPGQICQHENLFIHTHTHTRFKFNTNRIILEAFSQMFIQKTTTNICIKSASDGGRDFQDRNAKVSINSFLKKFKAPALLEDQIDWCGL